MARKMIKRVTASQGSLGITADCTALYLRVSTEKQAAEGFGLDAQRTQLLAYCQGQGWNVCPDHIYVDAGISGKSDDRPEFQRMLTGAKQGAFTRIVALKIDRIARNLKNLLELIETLNALNVALVCVKEQFDTGTAQGRFMLQVLGAVGELERSMISERVDAGRREKAKQGGYNGSQCPLGYTYQNGKFEIDAKAAVTIKDVFGSFVNGQSMASIAAALNAGNVKTATGGQWYASTVRYILQNGFYCGLAQWDETEVEGSHPAIISRKVYEDAHARLKSLKPGKQAR